jgi:Zn-dependent peptidase ImmA (M78 family)
LRASCSEKTIAPLYIESAWVSALSKISCEALTEQRRLKKRTVLHEFHHFLVGSRNVDIPERIEEKEANCFAKEFLKLLLK